MRSREKWYNRNIKDCEDLKMSEQAQRQELHRKIWAIADDVRGAVDGWDFKQYIFGNPFLPFYQ